MTAYSAQSHSELTFPELPQYEAKVVPIYWEPMMGSGERVTAIIGAVGGDGEVEAIPVIKPSVLGIMFPGQKRNARNMLTWVASSLKRHLMSRKGFRSWECPITGFSVGKPLSSIGDNLADTINQAKMLYCSLSAAASSDSSDEEKLLFSQHDTDSIRTAVISTVRSSLGVDAERFIVPEGIRQVREKNRNHYLEISFEDDKRVGSIVSAYYTTQDTVQKHILGSQGDLLVAAQLIKKPVMYIAAPEVGSVSSKTQRSKIENMVDELEWKLKKLGVKPEIYQSADEIARSVCEQWA